MEILSVGVVYALSVAVGIGMVSAGNSSALERRDAIVAGARTSDTIVAYRSGDRLRAALLDTAANLGLGGLTSTVLGVSVVGAYPVFAYRGWVGGAASASASASAHGGTSGARRVRRCSACGRTAYATRHSPTS